VAEKGKADWFTKRKWVVENKFLLSVLLFAFIVYSVPMFIVYFSDPNNYLTRNDYYCYTTGQIAFYAYVGIFFGYFTSYFILAYLLRRIAFSDAFNMKNELIGVAIVGFICVIAYFVSSVLSNAIQFEYILSVGIVIVFTISYTWPTILAIRENKRRQFYLDGSHLDEDDEKN